MIVVRFLTMIKKYGPTLTRLVVVGAVVNALLFVTDLSDFEHYVNFNVREYLDEGPRLDPRIKLFAMDDKSVSYMGASDLKIENWVALLERIDRLKPAAIVVTKLFALVDSQSPETKQQAIEALGRLKTPLITTSFSTAGPIRYRDPFPLAEGDYHLDEFVEASQNRAFMAELHQAAYVYGPEKSLFRSLKRIGHFHQSDSRYSTLLLGIEGKYLLPHFMLKAAQDWRVEKGVLMALGREIPTDASTAVSLNYSSKKTYLSRTRSLKVLLEDGTQVSGIDPGDYVIILPSFYTGAANFFQTPLGPMPRSYSALPVLNGILTGQWLERIHWLSEPLFIQITILVGFVLAMGVGAYIAVPLTFLGTAAAVILGLLSFAYGGYEWPWMEFAAGFSLAAVLTVLSRVVSLETNSNRMKKALSGLLPQSQVAAVLKDPTVLDLQPTKHPVSIMFIDIVGFSLISKKISTEQIFNEIKEYLQVISEIVLRWDGVVDKTLGDGMLCFFGFDIRRQDEHIDHVEKAIQCAFEIQKLCYQKVTQAAQAGKPILPLRIGINTAEVIVGNLGGMQRIDITMMGDGVNFASRLETACDPFKMMIGASTKQALGENTAFPVVKRLIQIKHFSELLEAYEIDPYYNNPEILANLKDLYWEWSSDGAAEQRFACNTEARITLHIDGHEFVVENFSFSGFMVQGPLFLGRGVVRSATLNSRDRMLSRLLLDTNLMPFVIEVRSGFVDAQGRFIMGLRIPGLNDQQKQKIFDCVKSVNFHFLKAE